ncbi:MAG: PhzF family phenazine biosynthesis protein, partial [Proteobacteria bacterium]|nr:PhzF family phenazine biosynthesis protein [Pseudomonadota bacterium]
MKVYIVDVFAERRYAGNQLAVVMDAAALTTERMQEIAAEMNFSETTFVIEANASRARVRIFTPAWELPFAGHPTVGTAWVLAGGGRPPVDGCSYILDLPVGPVAVSFNDGIGWMAPPEVSFTGVLPPEQAAALIGVAQSELSPEFPIRLAEVGPRFVLIGLKSLTALKSARLNQDLHADLVAKGVGVQCVFVFTQESYSDDADFAARMFFESRGYREDPAT